MVGKIHSMGVSAGISARNLKYYQREHAAVCPVFRHVGEWCFDLIWSKWNHDRYVVYNEFIYKLLYTNVYDGYMNEVSSETMPSIGSFIFGYIPADF